MGVKRSCYGDCKITSGFNRVQYFAITARPLAPQIQGTNGEVVIRPLSEEERFSIEDFYFKTDRRVSIPADATAIVFDHTAVEAGANLDELATYVEFGLGILTIRGFEPIVQIALLDGSLKCTRSIERHNGTPSLGIDFPRKITPGAASLWFRQLFIARKKTKDRLHITADRFVRYSRSQNTLDSLVDLCICLESMLDVTTEISFRFGVCLAKVSMSDNAEDLSHLLSDLYDLRSKVVHGSDPTKPHAKIKPHLGKLRTSARTILTTYILYLTKHTKEEWKKHLHASLFLKLENGNG